MLGSPLRHLQRGKVRDGSQPLARTHADTPGAVVHPWAWCPEEGQQPDGPEGQSAHVRAGSHTAPATPHSAQCTREDAPAEVDRQGQTGTAPISRHFCREGDEK